MRLRGRWNFVSIVLVALPWYAATSAHVVMASPAALASSFADEQANERVMRDAARSLVICVRHAERAGPSTTRASSAARLPGRLAARLAWLGARRVEALLESLPSVVDRAPGPSRPFELDPTRIWRVECGDSQGAAALLRALSGDPDVAWAEGVVTREAVQSARDTPSALSPGFPDDPLFRDGRQWGLDNRGDAGAYGGVLHADVRARDAWARSCGSPDLVLAIADTGLDPAHPEFAPDASGRARILAGVNVVEPGASWADSAAHGTMVTGVFASRSGDGAHFDSLGTAGLCGGDGRDNPGCGILAIKIAPGHATTATSFDLARAVLTAVALGARAVNVSFAGGGPSRLEREALAWAMARRCLVVAAAGNRGASAPRAPQYPAAYAADGLCLQVGASDAWDRRAVFSSYGPGLDVLAPGVDVWTTFPTYPSAAGAVYPGYLAVSGTSLAAPFGTGAAGLLFAARPELEADDARVLLRLTARDVGVAGPDSECGTGVIDAAAALAVVGSDIGIWHDEVAAAAWIPGPIDTLVISENGPGAIGAPWLWPNARQLEARATVALPDSFVDSVLVWPRVSGTMAMRGAFHLPYFAPFAEVIDRTGRTFTLRGYLFEVMDSTGMVTDIPLPRDQARFGFTVIGRVRRERAAAAAAPGRTLHVSPNPFRESLAIVAPPGCDVAVFDLHGRRVRRWRADGSVAPIVWNGRGQDGACVPPGLYWIRAQGDGVASLTRVIRLE